MFSTESMESYVNIAMDLNWTIESGYRDTKTDFYPLHTKGGLYGDNVVLIMTDMQQDPMHYCDYTGGFEVSMRYLVIDSNNNKYLFSCYSMHPPMSLCMSRIILNCHLTTKFASQCNRRRQLLLKT